jgi:hypothetical protein
MPFEMNLMCLGHALHFNIEYIIDYLVITH